MGYVSKCNNRSLRPSGFTPAFGRAVAPSARSFFGRAEALPFRVLRYGYRSGGKDGNGNSMNRYDYQFGITVNALGERFYVEGEAKHAYTYAKTGRLVLQQPGGVAFQIYDQTGIDLFRHGRDYPATNVEASTLAELAKKIGIDPEPFLRTIETFNTACRTDVAFMPGELDGKGTVGITPKKSNWAMPIVKGPFRAYPITGGVTFSFGGIQVDIERVAVAVLMLVEAFREVMVRKSEHHVCIHGDKAPVAVVGETSVARSRRERGDGDVVEA